MFTIRKATVADCNLINKMAQDVFPATYNKILSPEQLDYMMDWMYNPENIRKQMEAEGHIYFIAYKESEPCGYVSVQPQEKDVFHLQKIYVLPYFQKAHCGSFLFREAIKYIKEVHPSPCLMELNVNRNNKALKFYEHMGMKKLREGDFPIGNGYYMNDYIMGLEI
ncbi:GNAT family N-acetyltransferase [Bacteroides sp.]|uniref:GNAT family N-acetyltransferase n=1 Tax=Bacteroides sp. TaxID=29523 RepID=UPI00262301AF|nr:GNAT family N-acetyltransferase [Bacteroides sp.]MDD3037237.1 GNAT family N-acetyltransferase [Bacteroides sp.]